MGKYDGRTCLAIVFFRVVNAQIISQVTVKLKVKTEGYFLLLLYIHICNMSSQLNLLVVFEFKGTHGFQIFLHPIGVLVNLLSI